MSVVTSSGKPSIRLWSTPATPPSSRAPLLYSIDEALGVVFIDLLAVNDAPAVIQAMQQVRLNPNFKRNLNVCVDCSSLSHEPDADNARALASLWPRATTRGLTGRCAIVAGSVAAYVSARSFVTAARVPIARVRVFEQSADALLWLTAAR
jgi:hypothetical protein